MSLRPVSQGMGRYAEFVNAALGIDYSFAYDRYLDTVITVQLSTTAPIIGRINGGPREEGFAERLFDRVNLLRAAAAGWMEVLATARIADVLEAVMNERTRMLDIVATADASGDLPRTRVAAAQEAQALGAIADTLSSLPVPIETPVLSYYTGGNESALAWLLDGRASMEAFGCTDTLFLGRTDAATNQAAARAMLAGSTGVALIRETPASLRTARAFWDFFHDNPNYPPPEVRQVETGAALTHDLACAEASILRKWQKTRRGRSYGVLPAPTLAQWNSASRTHFFGRYEGSAFWWTEIGRMIRSLISARVQERLDDDFVIWNSTQGGDRNQPQRAALLATLDQASVDIRRQRRDTASAMGIVARIAHNSANWWTMLDGERMDAILALEFARDLYFGGEVSQEEIALLTIHHLRVTGTRWDGTPARVGKLGQMPQNSESAWEAAQSNGLPYRNLLAAVLNS